MIDYNMVEEIKKAPIDEKIQIIEDILQSLKSDMKIGDKKAKYKPFKIRKISLGKEVHVDRDELYSERGL